MRKIPNSIKSIGKQIAKLFEVKSLVTLTLLADRNGVNILDRLNEPERTTQ